MPALIPAPLWHRDRFVWAAASIGMAATAYALFAGRYLPYIDWSNHLGLIAVLADGGSTGALDYLERSFAPSPYLLFYLVTAAIAQIVPVDVAAKISIVLSTGLFVCAIASLAEACGRSPRIAAIAPLAVFGVSLGYGFGSFVFGTPFLFASLAAGERLFARLDARRVAWLALWLSLTYLAHGFLWLVTLVLLALRGFLELCWIIWTSRRSGGAALSRAVLRLVVGLFLSIVPAVLLALPATLAQVSKPEIEAGSEAPAGATKIFHFADWQEHRHQFGGHLLERGSSTHWTIMHLTAALWLLLLLAPAFAALANAVRGTTAPRSDAASRTPSATNFIAPDSQTAAAPPTPSATNFIGPEVYGLLLAALFLFGPMSVEWPSSIWYVYPRFGVIAAAALFVIPRPALHRTLRGAAILAACSALVLWNAHLNAQHIRNFSAWAGQYDPIREAVPRGARVLALTVVSGPDLSQMHPAMGSLYFYHLVDGASYTAFLFDKASLPVHSRSGVEQPKAPFWRTPHEFDPRVHGVEFDYLVLRGSNLISRTKSAGTHELVKEANGWNVFKTQNPKPRPQNEQTDTRRGNAP